MEVRLDKTAIEHLELLIEKLDKEEQHIDFCIKDVEEELKRHRARKKAIEIRRSEYQEAINTLNSVKSVRFLNFFTGDN